MPASTPLRRMLVMAYLLRQRANRQLHEWLNRRTAAYFETHANTWGCGPLPYALARDAASWQLARAEAEVCPLLECFESAFLDLNRIRRT